MQRKINIRPTTSVYATYKNISYKPWSAYAEFIDNSTQSYYDNEQILKSIKYWDGLSIDIVCGNDSELGDFIKIIDNAYGMGFEDFRRAVVLDSKPRTKSRSEFGMGLKTAACWFGSKWSVETTEYNSTSKYKTIVDVKALQKYRKEEIEVEETVCNKYDHGTVITIWDLNRKIVGRQLGKTKAQLKGMYKRDIESGDINISYNAEIFGIQDIKILDETLPNNDHKYWKKDVDFLVPYDEKVYKVTGFIAIREVGNSTEAGFTLFRHGRVVVGGFEDNYRPEEIFEKSNSYVYQRLFGELNLDGWPISQTKDAFDWYGGLEDNFIEKLKEISMEYILKAKDFRKRIDNPIKKINEMIKSFEKSGIVADTNFEEITCNIDNAEFLKNNSDVINQENNKLFENEEQKFKFDFIFEKKKYHTIFIAKKKDSQLKWLDIEYKNDTYIISWNINHMFFKQFEENVAIIDAMRYIVFALALSEIDAKEISINGKIDTSAIRTKMNDILKKLKGG